MLQIDSHIDLNKETSVKLVECNLTEKILTIKLRSTEKFNAFSIYREAFIETVDPDHHECKFAYKGPKYIAINHQTKQHAWINYESGLEATHWVKISNLFLKDELDISKYIDYKCASQPRAFDDFFQIRDVINGHIVSCYSHLMYNATDNSTIACPAWAMFIKSGSKFDIWYPNGTLHSKHGYIDTNIDVNQTTLSIDENINLSRYSNYIQLDTIRKDIKKLREEQKSSTGHGTYWVSIIFFLSGLIIPVIAFIFCSFYSRLFNNCCKQNENDDKTFPTIQLDNTKRDTLWTTNTQLWNISNTYKLQKLSLVCVLTSRFAFFS